MIIVKNIFLETYILYRITLASWLTLKSIHA